MARCLQQQFIVIVQLHPRSGVYSHSPRDRQVNIPTISYAPLRSPRSRASLLPRRKEKRLRVLIADPDTSVLDELSDIVRREGFLTATAVNVEQAIDFLYNEPIDIAIVDASMSLRGGESLAAYVRAQSHHVPLIATSADGSWETAQRVRIDDGPVFFYALKPLEASEIREAVTCAASECRRKSVRFRLP